MLASGDGEDGMSIVGAFAGAHTPQLLARPDTEDRDLVLRVHAAFARVKARLEALRPDAIVMRLQRGHFFGHHERMPEGGDEDAGRQLDPLGDGRGMRQRHHRLEPAP